MTGTQVVPRCNFAVSVKMMVNTHNVKITLKSTIGTHVRSSDVTYLVHHNEYVGRVTIECATLSIHLPEEKIEGIPVLETGDLHALESARTWCLQAAQFIPGMGLGSVDVKRVDGVAVATVWLKKNGQMPGTTINLPGVTDVGVAVSKAREAFQEVLAEAIDVLDAKGVTLL